jgi:hypothetical protein
MKLTTSFLALFLSVSLVSVSFLSVASQNTFAQDSKVALQRGYRTGYSDGYMAGYRDVIDNSAKNLQKHGEYKKADRAYNKDYGLLVDYRDGYQQGFERGYAAGFEKRSFDATIPTELNKRGVIVVETVVETTTSETTVKENVPVTTQVEPTYTNKVEEVPPAPVPEVSNNTVEQKPADNAPVEAAGNTSENIQPPAISTVPVRIISEPGSEGTIIIPVETELVVELIDDINTERSREGDNFKARVFSPGEINGAIIEGKISKIQKPGRFKRRAEMLLSFNRIVLSENRWSNFNAILTEVLPVKGDNVRRVDTEGTVEGRSSVKSDSVTVGATAGTGLVIGAIAGGPVGAAVGAGIGAAIGAGTVVVERGKHIKLNKSQQLRIKTSYETQIR